MSEQKPKRPPWFVDVLAVVGSIVVASLLFDRELLAAWACLGTLLLGIGILAMVSE